jgi:hypothetical protein
MRYVSLLAFAIAAAVAGVWVGEDEMFPSRILSTLHLDSPLAILAIPLIVLAVVAVLGGAMLWRKGILAAFAGAVILGTSLSGGYVFGNRELNRALGECPDATDRLRRELAEYHQRTGRYPTNLAELGPVPCQRVMRGTLLFYGRNGEGYDLIFGDWLVTWHATQEGMNVTK